MRRIVVGAGAVLFAGSLAWALFSPPAYSCPGSTTQVGLRVLGPNDLSPELGTPGELLPVCNSHGPGINHPVWGSRDDRVPLRASVSLAGAALCVGLIALTRRRTGDRPAYRSRSPAIS